MSLVSGMAGVALGLLTVTVAPSSDATAPEPPPAPRVRHSVAASEERAAKKVAPLTRPAEQRRANDGTQGRVNSTNDVARDAEEPGLVQPPLSGSWGF
jgi:hypothetical protein